MIKPRWPVASHGLSSFQRGRLAAEMLRADSGLLPVSHSDWLQKGPVGPHPFSVVRKTTKSWLVQPLPRRFLFKKQNSCLLPAFKDPLSSVSHEPCGHTCCLFTQSVQICMQSVFTEGFPCVGCCYGSWEKKPTPAKLCFQLASHLCLCPVSIFKSLELSCLVTSALTVRQC